MVLELFYLFFIDNSKTECSGDVTQCLVVFLWTLSVFVSNIKPQYSGNVSIFAFRVRGYEEIPDLLGPLGGVSHTL
jgi:hypothetical protein